MGEILPTEAEKTLADSVTSKWWDRLKVVNQLDSTLSDLDQMYWRQLDSAIADALAAHRASEVAALAKALKEIANGDYQGTSFPVRVDLMREAARAALATHEEAISNATFK